MSLPIFTIAWQGYGLYHSYEKTGVVGWPDVVQALAKIARKMAAKSAKVDHDALDDMVSLARSRVPVDTGLLLNGITGEVTDEGFEFRASAVHEKASGKPGADYARFVEFGHLTAARRAAAPAVADDAFFSGAGAPRARPTKGQTQVEPQPFFFNSAEEALQKRGLAMDDVIAQSAQEDGWQ
ncbi:HK97 gp10 family phage protein [Methylocella silvestris]|uniref:Uncharacterized protein n=1 Tax=Methylocella silvestris TaxID=199596 RepID=A0A2J7TJR6_METSI|nr:HK97 gp10 family phage protein [Methylocella silvestris]PNG27006.1 hypothetical protein CR492_04700 [Methylocella silvestris]